MKSFSLVFLFALLISLVFADAENYEITYYGCPEECHTQRNPACDSKMKLGDHDYFAALVNILIILFIIYIYLLIVKYINNLFKF